MLHFPFIKSKRAEQLKSKMSRQKSHKLYFCYSSKNAIRLWKITNPISGKEYNKVPDVPGSDLVPY